MRKAEQGGQGHPPPPISNGNCKDGPPEGLFAKCCPPSTGEQGVGVGRVGTPGPNGQQQQLTWLSDVTRCWTIWPSAVVISWM